jgi:hypothetical protein
MSIEQSPENFTLTQLLTMSNKDKKLNLVKWILSEPKEQKLEFLMLKYKELAKKELFLMLK